MDADKEDPGGDEKEGDPESPPAEEDPKPEKEPEPEPIPESPAVEPSEDSTIKDIESKFNENLAALEKRLDSGDIEFEAYKKELIALERERTRAVVREEMTILEAEKTWKREQSEFLGQHKYLSGNGIVFNAFAGEVNRLLADPSWSKKAGPDILAEAKKSIDSAFGKPVEEKKPIPPKEETPGEKAVKAAKKASANAAPPKTLRNVPAADANTDGDAFAYLDKLDGQAYEDALLKLSPEELDAYSKS